MLALLEPESARHRRLVLEALYGHLLLSGNAFVERAAGSTDGDALYLLRPDRVRSSPGRTAGRSRSNIGPGRSSGGYRSRRRAASRVLHLALFHPLDDLRGFAPLEAALMALDIHNAAGAWNKALLDNAARPSGALVYAPTEGGNLAPEQFDRLKGELRGRNIPAPAMPAGRCCWKAGSTGRRWA